MIYELLLTLFVISCLTLILLVLIQKGKGSMGLGSMGGGTTMLFGGSGGQDLFQKITWALGAILMGGSLLLGLMKSSSLYQAKYLNVGEQAADNVPAAEALAAEKKETAKQESSAPAQASTESKAAQPADEQPSKPAQ